MPICYLRRNQNKNVFIFYLINAFAIALHCICCWEMVSLCRKTMCRKWSFYTHRGIITRSNFRTLKVTCSNLTWSKLSFLRLIKSVILSCFIFWDFSLDQNNWSNGYTVASWLKRLFMIRSSAWKKFQEYCQLIENSKNNSLGFLLLLLDWQLTFKF